MKRLSLLFLIALQLQATVNAQPTGGMPKTSDQQEKKFIPLEVPPPYSYEEGSVKRMKVDGRRLISFVGTTAMPPYFEYVKNTQTYERAFWQKQLLLSKGRWAFRYQIDCDSKTFDRDGDRVGWRDVYLDPTAYGACTLFCDNSEWLKLPTEELSQN